MARCLLNCGLTMFVSALVLTLDDNQPAHTGLLTHLSNDPRLEVGSRIDRRLPVVAETADARCGESLVEELQRLPGVLFVDVVLVDFSLVTPAPAVGPEPEDVC